ncbi:MAG TPA: histidine kinase [Clostridiaceae bacterium]|nr:histidine kinase [Clostridiaceae bacterium]
MKRIGNLSNFSIKTRLIILFLIMSLVPVVIVGYLSISIISHYSQNERIRVSVANLKLITTMIDERIRIIQTESIRISQDDSVLTLLKSGEKNTHPSITSSAKSKLYRFNNYPEIHSIYLFSLSENVYTNQAVPLFNISDMERIDWFKDNIESDRNFFIGEPLFLNRDILIPYIRIIKDYTNHNAKLGISMANIYESTFNKAFMDYGDILLLNENNIILSSSDKIKIGRNFFEAYNTGFSDFNDGESIKSKLNKKPYIITYLTNHINGYRIVELIPYNSEMFPVNDIYKSTIVIVLVCVILCIILALVLASYVTYPLRKLKEKVDALKIDNLDTGVVRSSTDEIGMLENSFSDMAQRLKKSMEHISDIQEKRRKAEYRAIELQINPHFLYNTLSSINWLANIGDTDSVELVTNSLSKLFRISVNRGKETIRVCDEIEHVRCYLEIQKNRYSNEFDYQIDVEPDVMGYYIIKIILQPLAENSLYHGIRGRGIKNGFIRISARQEDNILIFEVADNGNISIDKINEMNQMLQMEEPAQEYGIGMLNVHSRIRYYYKENYGLRYEKRGELTVAQIKVPIIYKEDASV